MHTVSSTKSLRVNLNVNSNLNYFEWNSEIHSLAASKCRSKYPSGLLHHVCTQDVWDIQHPPAINADGDLLAIPYPPQSILPAELNVGAAAAVIAARERGVKEHVTEIDSIEEIKDIMLESIGLENIRLIADPITGTRNLTLREIMDHMRLAHGVANVSTLTELKSQLMKPLESGKPFSSISTLHRYIHARLFEQGQAESEFNKCNFVTEAVSMYPEYSKAINDYKTTTPIIAMRTFDGTCAYVNLHQPNITASGAGYSNAAITQASIQKLIQDELKRQFTAGIGAGPSNRAQGGRVQAGRGRGGRSQAVAVGQRNYCFKHGYDGHTGPVAISCGTPIRPPPQPTAQDKLPLWTISLAVANRTYDK